MANKSEIDMHKLGHYSFIAGIIIAVLVALIQQWGIADTGRFSIWVMVVLGVIVGIMNISAREVQGFLVAAISLIIASSVSALSLATIWPGLTTILGNIIIFVAPAAIIVSLKAIYSLANDY